MTAIIGTSFGLALCKHFNLPADQVADKVVVNTSPNEIFGVTLTIALTGHDVKRIGQIMKGPQ